MKNANFTSPASGLFTFAGIAGLPVFYLFLLLLVIGCNASSGSGKDDSGSAKLNKGMQPVTFKAADGLTITANLYHQADNLLPVVLCHQANSSKAEYKDIAPRLNQLGFNCLAVDLRSGGNMVEGAENETANQAKQAGKRQNYIDAKQDIIAAIDYMYKQYNKPVILVGSSYSASLALVIAAENQQVRAVAAFSPGEYFAGTTDSESYVQDALPNLHKPVFITCAQKELGQAKLFFDQINAGVKDLYVPPDAGIHGARALWESTPGNAGYWSAFTDFMNKSK